MVNVAVMNPFDFTRDAFQLESQTLRNRTAAGVFGGALDGDAVEFPDIEAMINHRAATGRHDAFALVSGIQPIAQGRPTVGPINIQMIDHSAKPSLIPDAGIKPTVVCVLLLPVGDGPFDRRRCANDIHPWMPAPDMIPVGIQELEQFFTVLTVNQP